MLNDEAVPVFWNTKQVESEVGGSSGLVHRPCIVSMGGSVQRGVIQWEGAMRVRREF